jgi:3-oxoacyl-[acyl-carrier protein] reductase
MMKTIALFGGSGGLGSQLKLYLEKKYLVTTISSKDVDVVSYESVKDFFNSKDIDIVINLSAYNYDSFIHKYNQNNHSQISKQIDVNILGTINIVSCCISKMREKNFGRIILASSILADHPVIGTSIYAGCKGFIDSLTKTVAIENVEKNITCNSLQLGYFDGGLTHRIPDSFKDSVMNSIPSKRWGTIEELYQSTKFLIDNGYVTGQNINVSGGII